MADKQTCDGTEKNEPPPASVLYAHPSRCCGRTQPRGPCSRSAGIASDPPGWPPPAGEGGQSRGKTHRIVQPITSWGVPFIV